MVKLLRRIAARTDARRRDAITKAIRYEESSFELAVERAQSSGSPYSKDLISDVRNRFQRLHTDVSQVHSEVLQGIVEQAEGLSQLRAYLTPSDSIVMEGSLAIDTLEEWGVPKIAVKNLRDAVDAKLKSPTLDVAREALFMVFKKFDAWERYAEAYAGDMRTTALALLITSAALLLLSMYLLSAGGTLVWGLFTAGATGACISVLTKLPRLTVWGDYNAHRPRVVSRIAMGLGASVAGCAFLSWGVIPLRVGEKSFGTLIAECTSGCPETNTLILMGVAVLFGFSERAWTSIENRVFAESKR